jgi:hypothetical protein
LENLLTWLVLDMMVVFAVLQGKHGSRLLEREDPGFILLESRIRWIFMFENQGVMF